ncbi:alpha/beta fold hydrolase [Arthrobacter sp. CAN_C5]|uniref:alpha/beta fold hydrolase n=1 Tax=Arthrobacter sp. CAN_C5 TaxID=2760706 RepID=UPI001AEA7C74|nr:alpha/beta hydrolase [Arthrobacter sp. CAN_C5]MBP2216952.1 pimeloyl-ACP methyl ester carboxylesterase [Arthrobacter sp. CAN_C5]
MSDAFNSMDGVRVSYQQTGAGPTVILVHGTGLSRAVWRGLGYTKALEEQFHLVSIDLRGHGRSDKPHHEDDYRMELLAGDILTVMDALDVRSAHYFGYSAGARIGFSLIAGSPHRIKSFTSAGGTYRPLTGQIDSIFFAGYDNALGKGGMPEFLQRWGEAQGRTIDPQTSAAFMANDPLALRAFLRQGDNDPGLSETQLQAAHVPTLLFAGSDDTLRYKDSQRAAHLMPRARFHALPGRNHGTTLMPPQPLLDMVTAFVASTEGSRT